MKYRSVVAAKLGGPEVLQVIESDLRPPTEGEARIKVLAAAVCRPDVTVRRGEALYSGTPLGKKPPFVPGYAVIGDVEAVGAGASGAAVGDRVGVLTVTGGYSEYLYWRSDRLIPAPQTVDPAEAVTLILNYIVAYQALHRSAKVRAGEKALIIGASGGIGTALLQLGRLAGLEMYGLASRSKHGILCEYGAAPIDYHTQDFVEVIRRAEPGGIDVVIDGVMSLEAVRGGLSLLRRGGRVRSSLSSTGDSPGCQPAAERKILQAVRDVVLFCRRQAAVRGRLGYAFQAVRRRENLTGDREAVPDPGGRTCERAAGEWRGDWECGTGSARTAVNRFFRTRINADLHGSDFFTVLRCKALRKCLAPWLEGLNRWLDRAVPDRGRLSTQRGRAEARFSWGYG